MHREEKNQINPLPIKKDPTKSNHFGDLKITNSTFKSTIHHKKITQLHIKKAKTQLQKHKATHYIKNGTSLLASSEEQGRTKFTVNLEGIEEGFGGRGLIKARGVFGGSMLGTIFFHASINAASAGAFASRSLENRRQHTLDREMMRLAAVRSMPDDARWDLQRGCVYEIKMGRFFIFMLFDNF